jgi:hypothetical protein
MAFDETLITLPVDQIMPLKLLDRNYKDSTKYKMIVSSIAEIGIIEPPAVIRDTQSGRHILLDGHLRVAALKELGKREVTCLLSSDDEAYTFNKHTNRLPPIQENRMICRALERGVSEEKLAKALNLDVSTVLRKRHMLKGICPEVVEMLKDKVIAEKVFGVLRRMKAYRQVEAVMIMRDFNNYTVPYAHALLAGTPQKHLVDSDNPKKIKGLDKEQMMRMENEMSTLQKNTSVINDNLGTDMLTLQVAKSYLTNLLGNARILRYLGLHHSDILIQFKNITEMTSLAGE